MKKRIVYWYVVLIIAIYVGFNAGNTWSGSGSTRGCNNSCAFKCSGDCTDYTFNCNGGNDCRINCGDDDDDDCNGATINVINGGHAFIDCTSGTNNCAVDCNPDSTSLCTIIDHSQSASSSPTISVSPSRTRSTSLSTSPSLSRPPSLSTSPSLTPSPSPPPPQFVPLNCNYTTSDNICYLSSNLSVAGNQTLSFNYSSIHIPGNLIFSNSSFTSINSNQTISSSGSIVFGGNLVIHLTNYTLQELNSGNITLNVTSYNNATGEFNSVQIDNLNLAPNECGTATSTPVYGGNSLQMLVTPSRCDTEKDEEVNRGLIIGLVVGVGGFLILLLVVVSVVIGISIFVRRRKVTAT
eukprot:TRINITY_DN1252_c0_g1_i1.p1 TRINITY_DN1252_c0_g1~~TRINITY_DN1252_c0_g1_i1.p1  ORF type:complete len:362 (-),score=47.33 TRINITY_DN1252_c0_g1_i1:49-1104(-)